MVELCALVLGAGLLTTDAPRTDDLATAIESGDVRELGWACGRAVQGDRRDLIPRMIERLGQDPGGVPPDTFFANHYLLDALVQFRADVPATALRPLTGSHAAAVSMLAVGAPEPLHGFVGLLLDGPGYVEMTDLQLD